MWLTYRLSERSLHLRTAGSEASVFVEARGKQGEASLGQDMRNILLDLSREGPFGLLRLWRRRWRDRKELARLLVVGPYMIEDIGLTVDQSQAEAKRRFWRR